MKYSRNTFCFWFLAHDHFRRIKRGGSRGFVLNDDSLDEGFYMESLNQGQNWLEKYQNKFANGKFSTSEHLT